ncbi:PEP-CTERM sorting domain-containing protein [Marinobacteraceae bacterium S3BR75-40.1]
MNTLKKMTMAGLLAGTVLSAQAAPIISVSGEGMANASAAEASFLAGVWPELTEDFESFTAATGSGDQSMSIVTSVGTFTSDVTGSGGSCDDLGFQCDKGLAILDSTTTPFNGRFATSPDNWLDSMDAQEMTFSPIGGYDSVGFYMTDPNDAGGRFDINGVGFNFNDIFGSALGSGKVFYVSIFDDAGLSDITIVTNNSSDGFGIDDVTIGVPEPGTIALLGLGLAGVGFTARRKS